MARNRRESPSAGWSWLLILLAAAGCDPRAEPLPAERLALASLFDGARTVVETRQIDLGTVGAREQLREGWGGNEADGETTFAWGLGERSVLRFEVVQPRRTVLELVGWAFPFPAATRVEVTVELNGRRLGKVAMRPYPTAVQLEIPARRLAAGENRLTLRYSRWREPGEDSHRDTRPLAVAWDRIDLRPAAARDENIPSRRGEDLWLPWRTAIEFFFESQSSSTLTLEAVVAAGDEATGSLEVEVASEDEEERIRRFSAPTGHEFWRLRLPRRGNAPVRLVLRSLPTGDGEPKGGLLIRRPELRRSPVTDLAAEIARPRRQPSILVYLIDTLRADHLGCYGYPLSVSPAIDRFAAESTLFQRVSAHSSWTRPAVATLLTGLDPRIHGANNRGDRLPEGAVTLAERLRDLGYETAAVVTNGNAGHRFGFGQGFESFVYLAERRSPEVHRSAEEANEAALSWLRRRDPDRPFLLYLHASDPHAPTGRPRPIGRDSSLTFHQTPRSERAARFPPWRRFPSRSVPRRSAIWSGSMTPRSPTPTHSSRDWSKSSGGWVSMRTSCWCWSRIMEKSSSSTAVGSTARLSLKSSLRCP